MFPRWKIAAVAFSIPALLLCASSAFGQYVYQIDNGSVSSGFNNTFQIENEDNWVGNTFTAIPGATILNSIYFLDYSGNILDVTAALYSGTPGSDLALVPGSVNTVQVSGALRWQTVPFATPQIVTTGEVFTAALLVDDVPENIFPFTIDSSGNSTESFYDVSNPVGSVNTYNLASPNFPTPIGNSYPVEYDGFFGTNAPVGTAMLARRRFADSSP
jgi:hypothetical protein